MLSSIGNFFLIQKTKNYYFEFCPINEDREGRRMWKILYDRSDCGYKRFVFQLNENAGLTETFPGRPYPIIAA